MEKAKEEEPEKSANIEKSTDGGITENATAVNHDDSESADEEEITVKKGKKRESSESSGAVANKIKKVD